MTRSCKGNCSNLPKRGKLVGFGNKTTRCSVCGVYYLNQLVVVCSCCGSKTRSMPRNSRSRNKINYKRY
jgi:rRNA maturation endonuclease Nob1